MDDAEATSTKDAIKGLLLEERDRRSSDSGVLRCSVQLVFLPVSMCLMWGIGGRRAGFLEQTWPVNWGIRDMRQFRYLLALLFAVALVAAACGDSDDTDDSSSATTVTEESTGDSESTTSEAPAAEETATAGGLEVARVDLSTGTAQVINTGDAPVDLSGHWVCNRPDYSELPPVELGPGEGIEVEVAGVSETGGEVAIYTSNNFESSDDIVSYVQWGSGGGRASVAEEAGVWSGPPVGAAQEAIALVGEPGSAEAWE